MALMCFTLFCERVLNLRLTAGQRILSKVVFEGIDPLDLPADEQPLALEMLGGVQRIPKSARSVLVLRLGRWSGKSTLCAAHGIYRMLVGDVSMCGPGDTPGVIIISPRLKTSRIILRMAKAMVLASPHLAPMVTKANADSFSIRRWDGIEANFICAPKSKGGESARGLTILEIVFDESEFICAAGADASVSDKDILAGVMPRVFGAAIFASTPWPAESVTANLFDRNYGIPTDALAVRASTVLMRDHDPRIILRIEAERERDANNAIREYDCLPADVEGLYFESSAIEAAVSPFTSSHRRNSSCGIDLAFRSDSAAILVTERQGDKLAIVHTNVLVPERDKRLVPSAVCTTFAEAARGYGCLTMTADSHYIETAREAATASRMTVLEGPSMTGDKDESWLYLRNLFREGRVLLRSEDEDLVKQLKSILAKPMPGGSLKAISPRRTGHGHCDLVAALVNAAWADRRHGAFEPEKTSFPFAIDTQRGGHGAFTSGSVRAGR
jgi:hypothetical protein